MRTGAGRARQWNRQFSNWLKSDPEIAVRKIDIVNWASPVATQYRVSTIPRVEIYGRKGELVGTVKGADPAQVRQYVAQAKSAAR